MPWYLKKDGKTIGPLSLTNYLRLSLGLKQARKKDRTSNNNRNRQWSPGVAGVLSFLIPGLGQIYKSQALNGITWFFVTLIAYSFLGLGGLVVHACCVIGATSGE